MNTIQVVLNYKDYEALPNDGRRYEIHEGELSVMPAPSPLHQETLLNLGVILREHVVRHGLGKVFIAPLDVILADITIVQPDLVFVANHRLALITSRGVDGTPTLLIEVVSPSSVHTDRHTKFQIYARHGVPYYWIVDPDTRVAEAYELAGQAYGLAARASADETLTAPPFPDLIVPLPSVWPTGPQPS